MNGNLSQSPRDQTLQESDIDLDLELKRFEMEERQRLGLPQKEGTDQWIEPIHDKFSANQRAHTTLLVSGLTMAHDQLIQAALTGIGYKVNALDCPDNEALRFGKEFGNRGQCNPTYFTVGNLVKYLTHLRDDKGLSKEKIVDSYVFVTAGACGPCRFGTYVTEYRKALRDAGFDGFRVLLFQQTGGLKQATGEEVGLELNPAFFLGVCKSLIIGDVLNALAYRIRPYEVNEGETDRVIEECKALIGEALVNRKSLLPPLVRCRKSLAAIKVDRSQIKPRVAIIGEFWAMTTEGDGNYKLQRFLESEGAEVDVQLVTAWLLYMLWESRYDTKQRATLKATDGGQNGIEGKDVRKHLATLWAADKALRTVFQGIAKLLGLFDYHLPDMDALADLAHKHYNNHLRGGEGHLEVAKVINNVANKKTTMTLSVKPFGCMPSSGVSDGVQSLITELYPETIFLPIETSGDGAVNVYSRIQMQLFKAKKAARHEVEKALSDCGLGPADLEGLRQEESRFNRALHRSPHMAGCTTADLVHDLAKDKERTGSFPRRMWQRKKTEAPQPVA